MTYYIPVVDEKLNATKKGLRMKAVGVEVDEYGRLKEMIVEWTQYRRHVVRYRIHVDDSETVCFKKM